MDALKDRIINDGQILAGDILKVDSFLNHQVDTAFLTEIGREFAKRFSDCEVTKILTIEASGIAVGFATSQFFNHCPIVFAKKGQASNMGNDVYFAKEHSFTHNQDLVIAVSKKYLHKDDKILILDDFLANGEALKALLAICAQAECEVVGAGIVIEKAYMKGGKELREQGVRIESLARINSMSVENGIEFCSED